MKKVACRRAPPSVSNTRGHNRCDPIVEYQSLKHKDVGIVQTVAEALGAKNFLALVREDIIHFQRVSLEIH